MAYDLYIGLLHKQLSYATAHGPWTCATPKSHKPPQSHKAIYRAYAGMI